MDLETTKKIRIPITGGIPVKPILEEWTRPKIVCVRRFFGMVYFRLEREYTLNGVPFGTESLRGFCECSEEKFLEMAACVGKECDVSFTKLNAAKAAWTI